MRHSLLRVALLALFPLAAGAQSAAAAPVKSAPAVRAAKAKPAASAAACISSELGWSGDSPSGRLLTMALKPAALIWAMSSGLICGETVTWSLIRFSSK